MIEVSAFKWVPPFARGLVRDLRVRWALEEAGLGASLQHYNPLVDEVVRKHWGVHGNWQLRAQMPFGSNEGGFGEKDYIGDAERFRVFG